MGKIQKFVNLNIRKITGGKDPERVISEFIGKINFDPEEALKDSEHDHRRWMLELGDQRELEILLERIKKPHEATLYMGINVAIVPIRGGYEMLAAALEIADGLIGVKVSLVGHYLVISASFSASELSVDELEYQFKMLTAQQEWFSKTLARELEKDKLPME
jgi:hypothetical protein